MTPVFITPQAQRDLDQLQRYLSDRFSPTNAEKYVRRLIAACKSIGLAPHRGTQRDDLRPGLRVIGFERRVAISFETKENAVYILAILYGGRTNQ